MKSISHAVGGVFQPLFHLIGWILAELYSFIPNYAVAIALLTLIIMGILTPFTVKSTRSMKAMQKLQPEIKKLQQKYKGPENRQLMNDELMKLYKEEGVNPLGGCLPLLLQAPFLFILYSVIKGLTLTVTSASGVVSSTPRYIPTNSKMYLSLVKSVGQLNVWGMDLSLKPFSSHGTVLKAIPFFIFVIIAVALQYFQMATINSRNKRQGQVIPSQQQTMQRILPIVFAYFYLVIPAAVVIYMIISTCIRILTQYVINRADEGKDGNRPKEVWDGPREIPAAEESEAEKLPVVEKSLKPSTVKRPNQSNSNSRPKNQPRPVPKPQTQPRSKAKRKRKAR
jgi:YidC/Oxa1 family membrane protein insertase